MDFRGSKGAQINPQTVFHKSCINVNFCDAEIIGSFDDCNTAGAKFEGCINTYEQQRKVENRETEKVVELMEKSLQRIRTK